MNRLGSATSPYLLQHRDNPVDWWPWCDEAFAEARRRDVPVLLSIGYAACHWCHVMAHESFEDEGVAELVNAGFVAIKVDREERPDVDAVYMQATQAMTGQGGWPMTVFLTHHRQPFYAGTYFPPAPHSGLPSFRQLLDAITSAWRDRRQEVERSAGQIVSQLALQRPSGLAGEVTEADLAHARAELRRSFDPTAAGFGTAPKFPPSMVLEALLRLGDDDSVEMAAKTCAAMARGGIYDQLRGGFARYSVDASWVVPHFEKMLYDNALLLGVYTHWWRRSQDPLAARVVEETVEWLLAEMATADGGFAASLDADSLDTDGRLHEGAFYAWSPAELIAALGEQEGRWAAATLSVTAQGTFERGRSTLQLLADPDPERWAATRRALRAARDTRARPGRDDKVVAAWNGWLVCSLVEAAMVFGRSAWLGAAQAAGQLLWRVHWVDGRLRRTSRQGRVGSASGILEDYGAVVQAFVRLAAATTDPTWLGRATALAEVLTSRFDDGQGGFFDTADDAEELYARPADPTDNATPSGLSSAVHALALLGRLTGESSWSARAELAAASAGELVRRAPRFAGWLLADAASRTPARRPVEVAVVAEPGQPGVGPLVQAAYRKAPAGSVVVAGRPNQEGMALLADRPLRSSRPTAYVCREFVCRLPVTTVAELEAELAGQPAR